MLGLLLDAAVIIGLVNIFHEDGPSPGWGTAIGTAIAISLGFLGCGHFLGPYLGVFSLVPMAMVAGILFWLACDVPIRKAFAAGAALLGYKVCLFFLTTIVFG